LLVKISSNDAKEADVQKALNIGNWASIIMVAGACFGLVTWMLPETMQMNFFGEGLQDISSMRVFYACLVGLVVGAGISAFTEYYTGLGSKPILKIVQQSSTGAGTNIIAGLATGMISTFSSVLLFAAAIWASYALAGFYGVALAASAMMATTAMQLAIDAFGPIADNAGGIAEMSEQDPIVRERTDILDAVGNTTAATGKGFAIASAALTSLALFAAYVTFTGIDGINIFKAPVLAMLFVGGMVPVVFSALAMNAVGKAAMEMVNEVVRQFKEIPGIMEGTGKPEYDKCVDISTKASLKEMMLPGILTIGFPILVVLVGKLVYQDNNMLVAEMLGGYMAGVTVSGVLWAIFQNNAGGAWDNAKKSFEAGVEINGVMTYKGSEAHKAAVTGDTVGDPFKDTSGPSMNILIKLTCLIGLVIAPILGGHSSGHSSEDTQKLSYSLGVNVATGVKAQGVESIDSDAIAKSFKDVFEGNNLEVTEAESLQFLQTYFKELQGKKQLADAEKAKALAEEGVAYLAENAKKEGVTTTESGLQYEVLTTGDGASPSAEDSVTVHYTGTLIDGTVFDSSVERGEPATFGVSQVIPGWTEALQLMSVGDKLRLVIPSELAYGPRGSGAKIGPNSILVFEVELIKIN
ncbi:sodium/proton-translocating pyrophosphatase, partial [Flavobacteriaceae bacterium]|nr:sodium/proton-translocating pyrophosphatase [Flavobacteriaceae bacterium]